MQSRNAVIFDKFPRSDCSANAAKNSELCGTGHVAPMLRVQCPLLAAVTH